MRTALLLATIVLTRLPPAGPPHGQASAYLDAVDRYQAGHFTQAVATMQSLDQRSMVAGGEAITRRPFDADRVRAAVLVHTEVYADTSNRFHLTRADWLVTRLDARTSRAFLRDWWLFLASVLQGTVDRELCAQYLQVARERLPDDVEILRASGALHELNARVGWSSGRITPAVVRGGMMPVPQKLNVRRELQTAADYLRQAARNAPDLDETHLRLGRVLHLTGDVDGAATVLEGLLPRPLDRIRGYLARAFLASVEHDRGGRQRSADLYLEALKLWPGAQSSFLGLSALLYADNQPDLSAKVIERLLEVAPESDPWLGYVRGEYWHFESRRDRLRASVRQAP